ncbi:MAG: cyclic nucleotide-binding domain-containing protein [Chloroflexota bacterium]
MSRRPPLAEFVQHLSEIPLFAGLEESACQEMARLSRWREYEAGEVVLLEGDTHSGLYYLQYGWLKVVKTSSTGREQILRFLESGDTFNEIGVFANQPNPATAITLSPQESG